jgi:hypothetical protein
MTSEGAQAVGSAFCEALNLKLWYDPVSKPVPGADRGDETASDQLGHRGVGV